jgi:hypothetical protein
MITQMEPCDYSQMEPHDKTGGATGLYRATHMITWIDMIT